MPFLPVGSTVLARSSLRSPLTSVCYHPELIRPSLVLLMAGASSHGPNFTLPPGVSPHSNPRDLIAELCQIIERQSQELLALRQEQGAQATSVLRCARRSHRGRGAGAGLGG